MLAVFSSLFLHVFPSVRTQIMPHQPSLARWVTSKAKPKVFNSPKVLKTKRQKVQESVVNGLQHFEVLSCHIREIYDLVWGICCDLEDDIIMAKDYIWQMVDHALLPVCHPPPKINYTSW